MTVFDMSSTDDTPCTTFFPSGSSDLNSLERRNIYMMAIKEVIHRFVDLSYGEKEPPKKSVEKHKKDPNDSSDSIHEYACEVLTLGLLFLEFRDSIKKGDGNRILCCWRYFLLYFKASHQINYSVEALTLLAQYTFLFSSQMAQQLLWSRTINTHGGPGMNKACDLHMEHLNREAKNALAGLGSNITDKAVTRVGRCIGQLVPIAEQFDAVNKVHRPSGRHFRRSAQADMEKLLEVLNKKSVFKATPKRYHKNFPIMQRNMIKYVSLPDLISWMQGQLDSILMYYKLE